MIATIDYVGLAALVAAVGSAIAAVISALAANRLHAPVQETRGNVADIKAAQQANDPQPPAGG